MRAKNKDAIRRDFEAKRNSYFEANYVDKSKRNYLRRLRNRYFCEEIDRLGELDNIIDVGSGPAVLYPNLLENCRTYYALDLVASNLEELKSKIESDKVHTVLADLDSFSWEKDFFDLVICSGSIEYTSDPSKAIQSLVRSMKPGGTMICSLPNVRSPFRIWSKYVYRHIWTLKNRLLNKRFSDYRRNLFSESSLRELLDMKVTSNDVTFRYFGLKLIPQPFDQVLRYLDHKILKRFELEQYRFFRPFCQEFIMVYRKPL